MKRYIRLFINYISHDIGIYRKLIISMFLMIVIPMLFLSVMFYQKFQDIIENEISSSYDYLVGQYIENLTYKLNIYQNLMETITTNSTVLTEYSNQNQNVADIVGLSKKLSKEIDSLIFKDVRSEIYNITLYSMNKEFPSDGKYISNISYIKEEPWFDELVSTSKQLCFFGKTPGLNTQTISMTRPIVNMSRDRFNEKLGYVKIDIDQSFFFSSAHANFDDRFRNIYFLDSQGNVILRDKTTVISFNDANIDKELFTGDKDKEFVVISGKKEILIREKIEKYGLQCLFFVPYEQVEKRIMETGAFIIINILVILSIFIGIMVLFSRTFYGRISLLVKKMKKVENGLLEPGKIIGGKDEIGTLDQYFTRMILKVKELINENYLQKLEKREAELNALQLQINPHFLYNTLQSIDGIASIHGVKEISTICQKLGEMFRYNINAGQSEFVTLKQEIRHIQNYVHIQKIRYWEKFDVHYAVSEELQECKILKFVLQPIIENAIYYAFPEKIGKGNLEIKAGISGNDLVIEVQDDGLGMTEEQVNRLNSDLSKNERWVSADNGKSIGLRNVNSRIRIVYGNEYGITIKSKINAGTLVTIKLPLCGYVKDGEIRV